MGTAIGPRHFYRTFAMPDGLSDSLWDAQYKGAIFEEVGNSAEHPFYI